MKKITTFLILLLIGLSVYAFASSFKPYSYPFIGRWQPAEDPRLIDDYGFQDIQNLRKDGKRLKGVSGHSKINTTSLSTTYVYAANAFHFRKDNPAESHVLVLSVSTGVDAEGKVWDNTTAIPTAGDFVGTEIHTDATGAGLGRFSMAPQGNMLYCNGKESKIWGGDEQLPTAFIISDTTVENTVNNPKDYTDRIRTSLTDNDEVAWIGGGNDAYTVLLMHMDGTTTEFADSSAGGHAPNANANAVTDTSQKKFGPKSGAFDGAGDYVDILDSNDFAMTSQEFTVDFWIYATTNYIFPFIQKSDDGNSVILTQIGSETRLYIISGTVEQLSLTAGTGYEIPINELTHVAAIRGWAGNANEWALTKNGVCVATTTDSDPWPNIAGSFEIGRSADYTVDPDVIYYTNGWIDEFRVSKGIARWTSDFAVPVRAYVDASLHWLVGYPRPLQGAKFCLKDTNSEAGATITVQEWNGSSWVDLSITDNTTGLTSTGTVTWSSTVDTSKPKYLEGQLLYWYQFHIDKGDATIYQVTVDAPIQDITNIWDGGEETITGCKTYIGGATKEYFDEAADLDWDSVVLSSMTTAEYWYVGFPGPTQGFHFYIEPAGTHENANAAVLTVDRWTGDTWETVSNLTNRTGAATTFNQSGVVTFSAAERGEEFERSLDDSAPFFYYRLGLSSGPLDGDTEIDQVLGIPVTYPLKGYKFPGFYAGRSFLLNETVGEQNKAIYSAYNAPDVWNGSDSGSLYFGDEQGLTAAVALYNAFQFYGVYHYIVCKQHETWRVSGEWTDSPAAWENKLISGNVGCVAPLSIAACDVAEIGAEKGLKRQVAIWQTDTGVVQCDGATIQYISDDIKCYWDRNDARMIPVARLDDSVGWYDPNLRSYKLLITSGTGEEAHNVELEYSLEYNEWTKLYREAQTTSEYANPLQVGFMVKDTVGKAYSYGVTDLGYMYRLENGLTWDGTDISEYIWTKDLMLDDEWPLLRHTIVEYFRLLYEKKATTGETISIAHYCDNIITSATTAQTWELPGPIDPGTHEYQTDQCVLGPCLYHSFKLSGDFDAVYDGMELIGLGLYYEPFERIRE